jgi:hypothetical protein
MKGDCNMKGKRTVTKEWEKALTKEQKAQQAREDRATFAMMMAMSKACKQYGPKSVADAVLYGLTGK